MPTTGYEPGHRTQEIPTLTQRVIRPQTRAAEVAYLAASLLLLAGAVVLAWLVLSRGAALQPAMWVTTPPSVPAPTVTR